MVFRTTQHADQVDAEVGDVADKQTVLQRGAAAVQQIDGRSRDLRSVIAEDAVAEERRLLHLAEVLDRDAAAARARVVAVHLDPFNRRIRPGVDLDPAAVGVEERRLAHVVRFNRRAFAGAGREVVGARDLEAAQDRFWCDPVAEVDDVVHHGWMTRSLSVGDIGIRRREGNIADRLQRDPFVPGVEPDQRLSAGRWPVRSGMDVDGLVGGIARSRLERVLNAAFRVDVIAARFRVENDADDADDAIGRSRLVLSRRSTRRKHARREQELKERATMILPAGHGGWADGRESMYHGL